MTDLSLYSCRGCKHPFYEHRESGEWQLLNPRRKRNLTGCTRAGCTCSHADDSHVRFPVSPEAHTQEDDQ